MIYEKDCIICKKQFNTKREFQLSCSDSCNYKRLRERMPKRKYKLASGTVGALSELVISSDLMKRGYSVFRALSPACFCDLIAIKDNSILKIEVRTGWIFNKSILFPKKIRGAIDSIAVYIIDDNKIFYYDSLGKEIIKL